MDGIRRGALVSLRNRLLQLLYGTLFVVLLPIGLVLWARVTEASVPLPVAQSIVTGLALTLAGGLLIACGWYALIVHGYGLPMNAFPPTRLVRIGVYRWIRNPIYIGFGLISAGISIAAGSASGVWLVTPTVILAAVALIFGFERIDLVRRFGTEALEPPLLSIPRGNDTPSTVYHRLAVIVWILIPWLLTWAAAQIIGPAPDAFETLWPFERRWPVWQWTELPYVSAYLFVPLTVLLSASQRALRRLALGGGCATLVAALCWFTIPAVAANRDFVPTNVLGELLKFQQRWSTGAAAFPSFHALWAMLAATAWSGDARHRHQPLRAWFAWMWAGLIVISGLTTGNHSMIDVTVAVLLFPLLRDPARSWLWTRGRVETLANSWREWRTDGIRVISHVVFAACAGGVGFAIIAMAVPPDRFTDVVWITLCALLGACLWAQVLEGSSILLRPFGWYGGVLGAVVGVATGSGDAAHAIALLSALAVAAPWIQAIGRLRCLVQGCCHGGPAPDWLGIRYLHRRSRVSYLPGLAGQPIHATPLYSIDANLIVGVVVLRMRLLGIADTMVIGVYLILASLARFVEEGYRAEPQTPIIGGLRSYQWLAIVSVLVGMWSTTVATTATSTGFTPFSVRTAVTSILVAVVTGVAMGIDFPRSSRRFSRLAPVD
jgi:protein-S-isoprenylcysteine O-methyltransferase Ste14